MLYQENGLHRHPGNPIFSPANVPNAVAVFNCGQTMYKGKTILLVPRISANPCETRMHVAESEDGIHFTMRDKPFIQKSNHPVIGKVDGHVIDPRVTWFEEDQCYYIMRPCNTSWGCAAILGKTVDFEIYEDIEIISLPHNRVPSLFPEKIKGKYVRLDRPYSLINDPHNNNQYGNIWLSFSPDLIHWGEHRPLLQPYHSWCSTKIGPTPPIKTKDGWLEIIHGVESSCTGQRYSLGAILLDLEDPTRIIGKTNTPLLTPDKDYEFIGRVPNVVFACGAIADHEQDRLRVYYGAADTCICLATGSISDIVNRCKNGL